MLHPTLRLHDGFEGTSPELREAVKELQQLLNQDGFPFDIDGLFGRDTEAAVKRFQREQGIDDDAIVGRFTWAALLGVEPSWTTTFPPTTRRAWQSSPSWRATSTWSRPRPPATGCR